MWVGGLGRGRPDGLMCSRRGRVKEEGQHWDGRLGDESGGLGRRGPCQCMVEVQVEVGVLEEEVSDHSLRTQISQPWH
jgi:hypothetical protein